jgi:sterol desaturase/sphingolipid hydroxylase (fatty acid hydroxylase superfamily)
VRSIQTIRGAYWIVLAATFMGVAVWESLRPKRSLSRAEGKRWTCHLVLMFSQSILLYGVLRWSGPLLTAAAFAESPHGVLNRAWMPFALRCILAIVALDFVRFATHRIYHAVPVLWRLHQVHHSDADFDVTTAGRIHPIESIFSVGAEMAAIALLAPPVASIFIWQLMIIFQSLFVHANARLPSGVEKLIRVVFFTPDLHRIHHSAEIAEQGKNFGELFPLWDKMFRCYLSAPAAGQTGMVTGLKEFPDERGADLLYLLALPFRRGG